MITDASQVGIIEFLPNGERRVMPVSISSPKSDSPGWWYIQARTFRTAFKSLLDQVNDNPNKEAPAIPILYLWGVAAELYLKAFLISRGLGWRDVKAFDHDLIQLLATCCSLDSRFDQEELVFLVVDIGPSIMDKGGMRYPVDTGTPAIYDPQMFNMLIYLDSLIYPIVSGSSTQGVN